MVATFGSSSSIQLLSEPAQELPASLAAAILESACQQHPTSTFQQQQHP
jgi:hypothetical protein